MADEVVLESNTPFTESQLWELSRTFYKQLGINAWHNNTPFYITSNPYIANSYANIVIRFIQDWVRQNPSQKSLPFYIVELGAGHGLFGFYMVKRLAELQASLAMTDMQLVYVMTDLAADNVEYWRRLPALQPYLQKGILDFAIFNVEIDQKINLINSKKELAPAATAELQQNPLIILANYVFDNISHNMFRIHHNTLQEGLVTLTTPVENIKENKPVSLHKVKVKFSYRDASLNYYSEPLLNAALLNYCQQYDTDGYLLYPRGALHCLKNLAAINNKLLLITTDKGYAKHQKLYYPHEALVADYTCSSMMVNFDAIAHYCQQQRGDFYHQKSEQSIITSAFGIGFRFNNLIETRQALVTYLDDFGPGNIYTLGAGAACSPVAQSQRNPANLLALLNACQWDPQLFNYAQDWLPASLANASKSTVLDLSEGMARIAANFYYLPSCVDTLYNIAIFFHQTRQHQQAIHYYQQSMNWFGRNVYALYNMALCCHALKRHHQALDLLHEVVTMDPSLIMARGWISLIESEIKNLVASNQAQLRMV